ncbi:MAG: T9SS type A sorting domain-containing protein [Flavobacteriaceae bacterium]
MNRFLIIPLLLITNWKCISQEYVPLLDQVNEWHFTNCYFGCLTDIYFTDGDTIVDNKTHKILDGYHYISRTFLLREDVSAKQIFLTKVNETNNEEYLLYDFSLTEGDIFSMKNPITPFPEDGGDFVLDSIRFRTLVDGNEYRHFYFSPAPSNTISDNNAIWIEGLGSLSIINAPGGEPDINGVGHLSCFFKNGQSFYANLDSIESCSPMLSIFDVKKEGKDIVILNPASSNFVTLINTSSVQLVQVFDIQGRKITSALNNGSNEINLDKSLFQENIYFVKAIRNNRTLTTLKFVI